MCFAPQRSALFQHLNFQKWSDAEVFCTFSLRNQLRATPQRRATFPLSSPQMSPRPPLWRAYFSTLRSHKTTKKHSVSRLSYLFAHLHLLSSDLFSCDSSPCWLLFHLSILSEVWLLNFLRKCKFIIKLYNIIHHVIIRKLYPKQLVIVSLNYWNSLAHNSLINSQKMFAGTTFGTYRGRRCTST